MLIIEQQLRDSNVLHLYNISNQTYFLFHIQLSSCVNIGNTLKGNNTVKCMDFQWFEMMPAFCRTRRHHWEELADLHLFFVFKKKFLFFFNYFFGFCLFCIVLCFTIYVCVFMLHTLCVKWYSHTYVQVVTKMEAMLKWGTKVAPMVRLDC